MQNAYLQGGASRARLGRVGRGLVALSTVLATTLLSAGPASAHGDNGPMIRVEESRGVNIGCVNLEDNPLGYYSQVAFYRNPRHVTWSGWGWQWHDHPEEVTMCLADGRYVGAFVFRSYECGVPA